MKLSLVQIDEYIYDTVWNLTMTQVLLYIRERVNSNNHTRTFDAMLWATQPEEPHIQIIQERINEQKY